MINLVNDYRDFLSQYRELADNTVYRYTRSASLYHKHSKKGVEEWRADEIMGYLHNLSDDIHNHTLNIHVAWIRQYLKFCKSRGVSVIDENTITGKRRIKTKKETLTAEQVEGFIGCCDHERSPKQVWRNKLMIMTLYYTWLRVSELISLRHWDIDRGEEVVQYYNKHKRPRSFYMNPRLMSAYDTYTYYLKEAGIVYEEDDHIFISFSNFSYGTGISRNAVESIVKKYKELLKIEIPVTPHIFRHTFATSLMREGVKIVDIQNLLWHENERSTHVYLHSWQKDLKDASRVLYNKKAFF